MCFAECKLSCIFSENLHATQLETVHENHKKNPNIEPGKTGVALTR